MYSLKVCLKETEGWSWVKRFFACGPSVLDFWWRKKDFILLRSYNGPLKKYLHLDGHSLIALALPLALMLFLIYGPTLGWRGYRALSLFFVSCGLFLASARVLGEKYLFRGQLLLLIVLAATSCFSLEATN